MATKHQGHYPECPSEDPECGHWRGGVIHLCEVCEEIASERYPQGWRGYPGDTCEHGMYTGGCGADYICGYCEMGPDPSTIVHSGSHELIIYGVDGQMVEQITTDPSYNPDPARIMYHLWRAANRNPLTVAAWSVIL